MKPCSSSTQLALLIIIPFLISTIHATSAAHNNLINSTCTTLSLNDQNIDYGFCMTSLQAAPASRCATLRGLGVISIGLIRDNITDTHCLIRHLMKNGRWDPYLRQCLSDCFELFSDAIDSVKEAMRDYNMTKFGDANVRISSVMDAATTCEDGFKEGRRGTVYQSPLTKRNGDVFQLSAMALSVMHMIGAG